ncbi:lipoprotein [Streptomyces sp. NPDC058871]|uniref:lipoprotein n=1 Tax=unclassified Streptomyces TaxID=2593676 RepID=UPI00368B6019
MRRKRVRFVAAGLGLGALVAGAAACGPSDAQAARAGASGQDTEPTVSAPSPGVKAAGQVGGDGSPCRLPVSFDLAPGWEPKAVTHVGDEQFASLFEQGGTTLACEISAKASGNIGFLRVWVADQPVTAGDARGVLEAFVTGERTSGGSPVYTDLKTGAGGGELPTVQVAYETAALDEPKQESAFAVVTPAGEGVVVHLGGLDSTEHEQMLPAFRLARQSLKAAPQPTP